MSFLLKVRCHFLDGNLCVPTALLLLVPLLRGGLYQCDRSPSQALSFPGTLLLPCISPDAAQMSAGASTREGTPPCGCKGAGKGEVLVLAQRAQLFSPCPSSHSLKAPAFRRIWRFTAAGFSDSSAWCGTKLTDPSIAPVPWAGCAELDFPPKEKRFSGVTARFQASEVGPLFAKIYKQQLFVSSVSLHPERVAVSRGWFQSADSQPPAVLFYLRRLGLRMLWFCSEKTPLEIAVYLT